MNLRTLPLHRVASDPTPVLLAAEAACVAHLAWEAAMEDLAQAGMGWLDGEGPDEATIDALQYGREDAMQALCDALAAWKGEQ